MIFLHIPKTAGTAISQMLASLVPPYKYHNYGREEDLFYQDHVAIDHETIISGHLSWEFCSFFGDLDRATVLRDPEARVVSQVQHWLAQPQCVIETRDDGGYEVVINKEKSLSWNISHILNRPDLPLFKAISNAQTSQLAHHHYARPIELDASYLALAKLHMEQCRIVGRTEKIGDFLKSVAYWFEKDNLKITKENQSHAPSNFKIYDIDKEAISLIKKHNMLDKELYNFYLENENIIFDKLVEEKSKLKSKKQYNKNLFIYKNKNKNFSDFEKIDGHINIQILHFIGDIIDLQNAFSDFNFAVLGCRFMPREFEFLVEKIGKRKIYKYNKLYNDNKKLASNQLKDKNKSKLIDNKLKNVGLYLIDNLVPNHELMPLVESASFALGDAGCVVLQDALLCDPRDRRTQVHNALFAEGGLVPAFSMDCTLFYVKPKFLNLYQSLFKAKMHSSKLRRFGFGGYDFYTAESKY